MSQQMIVWCAIVGVLLFAVVFRTLVRVYAQRHRKSGSRHRHFIEMGSESEMFYIPGDDVFNDK